MQAFADSNMPSRTIYRAALLIIMAVCLIGFAVLATAVHTGGDMVHFDQSLANALYQRANPVLIVVMRAVTLFGLQVPWVLLAVTGLALLVQRRWLLLAMLIVSWTGGVAINTVSKAVFVRPRPVFDAPLLTAMFYSFPSGHAMFAAIVYGLFAYLLVRRTTRLWLRAVIVVGAAALVALVGFSRLYLGVHYFSDVVAGILLGVAWLMLCILGLEIASNLARAYHKSVGDGSDRLHIPDAVRRQNDEC